MERGLFNNGLTCDFDIWGADETPDDTDAIKRLDSEWVAFDAVRQKLADLHLSKHTVSHINRSCIAGMKHAATPSPDSNTWLMNMDPMDHEFQVLVLDALSSSELETLQVAEATGQTKPVAEVSPRNADRCSQLVEVLFEHGAGPDNQAFLFQNLDSVDNQFLLVLVEHRLVHTSVHAGGETRHKLFPKGLATLTQHVVLGPARAITEPRSDVQLHDMNKFELLVTLMRQGWKHIELST